MEAKFNQQASVHFVPLGTEIFGNVQKCTISRENVINPAHGGGFLQVAVSEAPCPRERNLTLFRGDASDTALRLQRTGKRSALKRGEVHTFLCPTQEL